MTPISRLNDVDIDAVATLVDTCKEDATKAATTWRAEVHWKGGFRSEGRIREFDPVPSDEPVALGGTDTAPNPVEQLLAALGNCLAVGVAANATARNITLRSLSIEVEGDLDLSTFLGLAPGHAGFQSITARIRVDSDAGPEEISDLVQYVSNTSPVGHTLAREIPVEVVPA